MSSGILEYREKRKKERERGSARQTQREEWLVLTRRSLRREKKKERERGKNKARPGRPSALYIADSSQESAGFLFSVCPCDDDELTCTSILDASDQTCLSLSPVKDPH